VPRRRAATDSNALAILPFRVSGPPEAQYLREGMLDLMSVALDGFAGWRVIQPRALLRHIGSETEPLDVPRAARLAREAGAAQFVLGSVVTLGPELRVQAELYESVRGQPIASVRARGTLALPGPVADTIAGGLARQRLARSPGVARRPLAEYTTTSPQALEAYLVGEQLARRARWQEAADRALRADSTSSDAWMVRGFLLASEGGATGRVHDAFNRALARDPNNDEAWQLYAMVLWALGEDGAAEAGLHRALAINPRRPITLTRLAEFHWRRRDYPEARRWLDSAIAVDPEFYLAYWDRAVIRLHAGDVDAARRDAGTAVRLDSGDPLPMTGMALVEASGGDTVAARTWLDRFWRSGRDSLMPSPFDAFQVGLVLVALGDTDRALEVLERVRQRWLWHWMYLQFPELDRIRPTTRFQRLLTAARPPSARLEE
jgi:tetratricopeptide (TPR) repeat protein